MKYRNGKCHGRFFSVVTSCIGAIHSRNTGHSSLHVESHAALRRSRPNLEIPLSIKCICRAGRHGPEQAGNRAWRENGGNKEGCGGNAVGPGLVPNSPRWPRDPAFVTGGGTGSGLQAIAGLVRRVCWPGGHAWPGGLVATRCNNPGREVSQTRARGFFMENRASPGRFLRSCAGRNRREMNFRGVDNPERSVVVEGKAHVERRSFSFLGFEPYLSIVLFNDLQNNG
jgi:hypothetical protein